MAKYLSNKKEVALHLGIGVRTVTDWMRRRILPYTKVGRMVRFYLPDCELALKKFEVKSRD
jgi:excisionase family DNA binding protein